MIRHTLLWGNLLIRHGFLHLRGIDQRILGTVAFRDNGSYGKDITISMATFLGLEANGVLDRLVTSHFVC